MSCPVTFKFCNYTSKFNLRLVSNTKYDELTVVMSPLSVRTVKYDELTVAMSPLNVRTVKYDELTVAMSPLNVRTARNLASRVFVRLKLLELLLFSAVERLGAFTVLF